MIKRKGGMGLVHPGHVGAGGVMPGEARPGSAGRDGDIPILFQDGTRLPRVSG